MEDKRNMMIIAAVVVVVAVIAAFSFFSTDSYKNVDDSYLDNPAANESVRFTGTYFGQSSHETTNSLSSDVDVIRVGSGNTFVLIPDHHDKFDGADGNDFTLEGKFNVDGGKQKVIVNGMSVEGYVFDLDNVK